MIGNLQLALDFFKEWIDTRDRHVMGDASNQASVSYSPIICSRPCFFTTNFCHRFIPNPLRMKEIPTSLCTCFFLPSQLFVQAIQDHHLKAFLCNGKSIMCSACPESSSFTSLCRVPKKEGTLWERTSYLHNMSETWSRRRL